MNWRSDDGGQTYTAQQDSCQGLVWRTTAGEWKALVRWAAGEARYASFTIREVAQAWCEAQFADLAAVGRCTGD